MQSGQQFTAGQCVPDLNDLTTFVDIVGRNASEGHIAANQYLDHSMCVCFKGMVMYCICCIVYGVWCMV